MNFVDELRYGMLVVEYLNKMPIEEAERIFSEYIAHGGLGNPTYQGAIEWKQQMDAELAEVDRVMPGFATSIERTNTGIEETIYSAGGEKISHTWQENAQDVQQYFDYIFGYAARELATSQQSLYEKVRSSNMEVKEPLQRFHDELCDPMERVIIDFVRLELVDLYFYIGLSSTQPGMKAVV